jgi:hypothetical protein
MDGQDEQETWTSHGDLSVGINRLCCGIFFLESSVRVFFCFFSLNLSV